MPAVEHKDQIDHATENLMTLDPREVIISFIKGDLLICAQMTRDHYAEWHRINLAEAGIPQDVIDMLEGKDFSCAAITYAEKIALWQRREAEKDNASEVPS